MKRRLHAILAFFLAMACLCGCSSSKAVHLQGEFLEREHAALGVALFRAGSPGVRDWEEGYRYSWPFFSTAPGYEQQDVFSEKGNEAEAKQRQAAPPDSSGPPKQGKYASLGPRLGAVGAGALTEAVERFALGIRRPGWRVVPLHLSIGKVDFEAPYLKGLDALVILDYSWYGVFCRDVKKGEELADGGADLTARMIDLSSGKLLWQSPKIRIKTPLSCRCGDPGCFEVIARGMRGAVIDAQGAALDDFNGRTP